MAGCCENAHSISAVGGKILDQLSFYKEESSPWSWQKLNLQSDRINLSIDTALSNKITGKDITYPVSVAYKM